MNEDTINPAELEAPTPEQTPWDGLPPMVGTIINDSVPQTWVPAHGQVVSTSSFPQLQNVATGNPYTTTYNPFTTTIASRSASGRPLNSEVVLEEMWALYNQALRSGQLEIAERILNNLHYNLTHPF